MRRIGLLFLTLLLISNQRSLSQDLVSPVWMDSIVKCEQLAAEQKFDLKESAVTDDYDLNYLRAEWNIDPRVYFISGNVTYYFHTLSDLTQMFFDFSDSMVVNDYVFHGVTTLNPIRPGDNTVQIDFGTTVFPGMLDSVTIFFQGQPVGTGFGSFVQSSHNGDSILWTLSEPYGAKDWFPCKNSLNDKIDSIDILVTLPKQYRVGSNGVLIEDNAVDDSLHLMHWKSRYPIATYLIGISATNYAVINEYAPLSSGDTVKVVEYIYPEDSAGYESVIIPMIQLYSDSFGDYPFIKEKYGMAEWNSNGGMEHQTMSFVRHPGIFELIAHELGHQWFGDKVTCGSWQDIWLNESFATFLSGLSYEYLASGYWLLFRDGTRHGALRDSTGSVFCDDTTDVARIFSTPLTYQKGYFVLRMLQWKLGDKVFFNAIRNYINDPNLVYSFAHTSDLKKHLEDESGQNLDEYFNDWYYGRGYPSYHFKWSRNNDGTVSISIHQTQNNPAVSFFEMPLPIELKNAEHDTIIRIENDFNDENYVVGPFNFVPDSLKFDPEIWIASTHNTIEYDPLVSSQLILFPNPVRDAVEISYHDNDTVLSAAFYDVSGRKILSVDVSSFTFFNPVTVDVSTWAAGCYILELKTENSKKIRKFVKY